MGQSKGNQVPMRFLKINHMHSLNEHELNFNTLPVVKKQTNVTLKVVILFLSDLFFIFLSLSRAISLIVAPNKIKLTITIMLIGIITKNTRSMFVSQHFCFLLFMYLVGPGGTNRDINTITADIASLKKTRLNKTNQQTKSHKKRV